MIWLPVTYGSPMCSGRIATHQLGLMARALEMECPACQTVRMSPASGSSAFDSFNEIATVRIELRDTDPVIWRQVLHDVIQAVMGW